MKYLFIITVITMCISGVVSCKNKPTAGQAKPDTGMISPKPENVKENAKWQGTYRGITPCADCPGIEVTITLKSDSTYEMTRVYQDRESKFSNSGAFIWNSTGTQISLQNVNEQGAFEHYIIQDSKLILLTPKGELPEGVDINLLTLKKK